MRGVPLRDDLVEAAARPLEPSRLELPDPLAPVRGCRARGRRRRARCRCLVIAWRVTPDPSLRRAIDSGPSPDSRATSLSRVSSPSAANTGAASVTFAAPRYGCVTWRSMFFSCSVQPPSFMRNASARRAAGIRSKPDSTIGQHRAAVALVERELDERRRLAWSSRPWGRSRRDASGRRSSARARSARPASPWSRARSRGRVIWPRVVAPSANGPSSFTRNQAPNSSGR